jgi:hypothetical protein
MTNWQLIITLATLVFAIFGASWINLQMMKNYLDARIDGVNARIDGVSTKIDALSQKVDRIDRQVEAIFKPVFPKSGD